MSVTRWDPFQDLHAFREEMNRTFNRWFGREESEEPRPTPRWAPALDVVETEDAFRIDVEVPGLSPEDIDVTVDQGLLTVQGERRSEQETRERQYHRVERRYGAFRRSITLPGNVDVSRIQATYDNGVLHLTAPKVETAQPKRITVRPGTAANGQSQRVPVSGETPEGVATETTPTGQNGPAGGERPM